MVNYVCAKTVPDSTKSCLIKSLKSKFSQGSMPPDLLVCHMLSTRICAYPSNNPYNLILPPPLGQKPERNPDDTKIVLFPDYFLLRHRGKNSLGMMILKPQFVCLLLAEHPHTGGVYTSNNIITSVYLFSDYPSV